MTEQEILKVIDWLSKKRQFNYMANELLKQLESNKDIGHKTYLITKFINRGILSKILKGEI